MNSNKYKLILYQKKEKNAKIYIHVYNRHYGSFFLTFVKDHNNVYYIKPEFKIKKEYISKTYLFKKRRQNNKDYNIIGGNVTFDSDISKDLSANHIIINGNFYGNINKIFKDE